MLQVKKIEVNLSINIVGEEVVAYVIFLNNTPDLIYLDTWTICVDNIMTRDIFSVRDENNKHVLYSGRMAYRIIREEDFIELNSGESVISMITINKEYKLIKGRKYSIRFCVCNPV